MPIYKQVTGTKAELYGRGGLVIRNGENVIWKLNSTGFLLWKSLRRWTGTERLIDYMINEFSIDKERAKKDVESFLDKGIKEKMLLFKE